MATSSDILVKDTGDREPKVVNGDFHTGFSDNQHISHLFLSHKGNFLRTPRRGVGGRQFLNAPIKKTTISRLIRKEATADGYRVISINTTPEGEIDVRATRIST